MDPLSTSRRAWAQANNGVVDGLRELHLARLYGEVAELYVSGGDQQGAARAAEQAKAALQAFASVAMRGGLYPMND